MMTVRTRMAPSPTGDMHVGSLATLLKNYAYAKKNHGQFLLRIEDTDKTREVTDGITKILEIVKAYGLSWDEGPDTGGPHQPYIQSQRLPIYCQYTDVLVKQHKAYRCFCSKERLDELRKKQQAAHLPTGYDRHCLQLSPKQIAAKLDAHDPYVIRLQVPKNIEIEFEDVLRGRIKFNTNEVDDQVLIKSDGYPTYHLAVVVDDHLMKISHIIRGEEWISSVPKHILLYQAFGWQTPVFCHVPVFLNPDGRGKMSKRKGTVSAQSFLDRGYLPEAMLNFLMILGWTPKDQRDLVSLDEYINEFDIHDLHPSSVVFDTKKLDWINGQYIRRLSDDNLAEKIGPFVPSDCPRETLLSALPLIKERLVRLSDFESLTDFFYRDFPYTLELITKNADNNFVEQQLFTTLACLETLNNWSVATIETAIRTLQEKSSWQRGSYFMLLRNCLTGKTAAPPLFDTIFVLGQKIVLTRLKKSLDLIVKAPRL